VVSPYVAGGRTMAATATRPLAVDFMDLLSGSECEVEEFQLSDDPSAMGTLNGRTLAELDLRGRSGALVLAIRLPAPAVVNPYTYRGSGYGGTPTLVANPGGETKLGPGQLMVVLGSKRQLARFQELLGSAVVSVEQMPG
jgi:voltage-gated potassium channel